MLKLVLVAMAVALVLLRTGTGTGTHPPNPIVFYLHSKSGVSFLTLAETVVDTLDARLSGFKLPITAEVSNDSLSLGYVRGLSLSTTTASEHLLNTIEYDDGEYNGTICQHGLLDTSSSNTSELAVVGGTGAFRRVTGYSIPTLNFATDADGSRVHLYQVYLFYPTHENIRTI